MIYLWALVHRLWHHVPERWVGTGRWDWDDVDLWMISRVWTHRERIDRLFHLTPVEIDTEPGPLGCEHMTVGGNVRSATCPTCGPLHRGPVTYTG